MSTTQIPYESLQLVNKSFEEQFKKQLDNFLNKGWYILGDEVRQFEEEFAKYHQQKFVVGVASGLDAMILSLNCCNFKSKAEVIVPSNTYIATVLAILRSNLKPVFVEPSLLTYNIDSEKIFAAITTNTVAIMVVHLYGQCCNMDHISAIAKENNLMIIEDCAQAHGAKYKGKLAGTFGEFAAFSFYPTKNLGALGDAGAVICKHESDYKKLLQLRNYGSTEKYKNEVLGYNSRLDELQASFLRIKLPFLESINSHKKELAAMYHQSLKSDYILPHNADDYKHVYHIFNIRHPNRDQLKSYLNDHDIGTEIHYPIPPHRQKALKMFNDLSFPVAEEIHQTTLSLPCSFAHSKEQITRVIEVLNKF